jgi:hypothetical protein
MRKMPKQQLIILLMAIMALIIIGIAVFLFTHYSTISLIQGIILTVVAVVVLSAVMGLIVLIIRSATAKK